MIPLPHTGTVRGDLRTVLDEVRAYITSPAGACPRETPRTAQPVTPTSRRSARSSGRPASALVGEIVRRGVARGELPRNIDERFLVETATAPLYFRVFVVAGDVDDELIDRIVRLVIGGAGHGLVYRGPTTERTSAVAWPERATSTPHRPGGTSR